MMEEAATTRAIETLTQAAAVERRVWRSMIVLVAVATALAALLSGRSFTLGLMLGGLLALFNYRWLYSSLTGILAAGSRRAPAGTILKFVLRWLVVGALGYLAYRTGYFDAIGILAGLLAPAAAVMIEAGYIGYKTMVKTQQ